MENPGEVRGREGGRVRGGGKVAARRKGLDSESYLALTDVGRHGLLLRQTAGAIFRADCVILEQRRGLQLERFQIYSVVSLINFQNFKINFKFKSTHIIYKS